MRKIPKWHDKNIKLKNELTSLCYYLTSVNHEQYSKTKSNRIHSILWVTATYWNILRMIQNHDWDKKPMYRCRIKDFFNHNDTGDREKNIDIGEVLSEKQNRLPLLLGKYPEDTVACLILEWRIRNWI